MLVLSRKLSQQILIGSDISITVVKIEGNQVRLGNRGTAGGFDPSRRVGRVVNDRIRRADRAGRQWRSCLVTGPADRLPTIPIKMAPPDRASRASSPPSIARRRRKTLAGGFAHGERLEAEADLRAQSVHFGFGYSKIKATLYGLFLSP